MKRWFTDLRLHYTDGASLPVYLANIRREAAATLDVAERREFAPLIDAPLPSVVKPVETKPHKFVNEWTSTELLPHRRRNSRGRAPPSVDAKPSPPPIASPVIDTRMKGVPSALISRPLLTSSVREKCWSH